MQYIQNNIMSFYQILQNIMKGIKNNPKQLLVRASIVSIVMMAINIFISFIASNPMGYLSNLKNSPLSFAVISGTVVGLLSNKSQDNNPFSNLSSSVNSVLNLVGNNNKLTYGVGAVVGIIFIVISMNSALGLTCTLGGLLSLGSGSKSMFRMIVNSLIVPFKKDKKEMQIQNVSTSVIAGFTLGTSVHGFFTSSGILISSLILFVFICYNVFLFVSKRGGQQ